MVGDYLQKRANGSAPFPPPPPRAGGLPGCQFSLGRLLRSSLIGMRMALERPAWLLQTMCASPGSPGPPGADLTHAGSWGGRGCRGCEGLAILALFHFASSDRKSCKGFYPESHMAGPPVLEDAPRAGTWGGQAIARVRVRKREEAMNSSRPL